MSMQRLEALHVHCDNEYCTCYKCPVCTTHIVQSTHFLCSTCKNELRHCARCSIPLMRATLSQWTGEYVCLVCEFELTRETFEPDWVHCHICTKRYLTNDIRKICSTCSVECTRPGCDKLSVMSHKHESSYLPSISEGLEQGVSLCAEHWLMDNHNLCARCLKSSSGLDVYTGYCMDCLVSVESRID